jgi:L-ascorbate metabolism protein UlaG (beta-lactamase superfamily)
LLIENGADVNGRDSWGGTPLMRSVWSENLELARLYLEKGADPNLASERGDSPIMAAVNRGNTLIVSLLLDHGARLGDLNQRSGESPFHMATVHGDKAMVEAMLAHVKDVDRRDGKGRTALQLASQYGHRQVMRILRDRGASSEDLPESFGQSPWLEESLAQGEAVLWYLGHCGWAIKTSDHLLIFDYWPHGATPTEPCLANGHINPEEVASQNVAVFVSHEHRDHYDSSIFSWTDDIESLTYIFGLRPEELPEDQRNGWTGQPYEQFGPREVRTVNGMQIRTIESNDGGVGFLVDVDGVSIYHAGDHAGWRPDERDQFIGEIDYLAEHVNSTDFAFVNVTGCHHQDTVALLASNLYTGEKLSPKVIIPTHSMNNEHFSSSGKWADPFVDRGSAFFGWGVTPVQFLHN